MTLAERRVRPENAWYEGGVNIIDFSRPTRLREVAWYDIAPDGPAGADNWAAYPYTGPRFRRGPGIPVYASDGVGGEAARGFLVFRAFVHGPRRRGLVDHLNPQTMEE
ncbi:MAG: hypothetical protein ACRD2C_14600 [Acidimicrobiales bacterium]